MREFRCKSASDGYGYGEGYYQPRGLFNSFNSCGCGFHAYPAYTAPAAPYVLPYEEQYEQPVYQEPYYQPHVYPYMHRYAPGYVRPYYQRHGYPYLRHYYRGYGHRYVRPYTMRDTVCTLAPLSGHIIAPTTVGDDQATLSRPGMPARSF